MTKSPSPLTMLLFRHTRRRDFVKIIGGVALTWPFRALAQRNGKLFRIGWFSAAPAGDAAGTRRGFVETFRELGWIEGKNVIFETRYAENRVCRKRF